MNSLLQTLFMTPELRQRLYEWKFEETEDVKKEDNIPYQLQLLFGRLQLSREAWVDTKGLTKSFQWDYRESFTQHDVQEFCRVLFDAIERSVPPPHSSLITDLYEGLLTDYVQCLTCLTESRRTDKFLDLSLSVRTDTDYNDSLPKAFDTFVKPELLIGSNQYYCSTCRCKRDALKGLRFKAFPKVLVVQLKRFELDYQTMMRKKVSERVEFPVVLDLNSYIGPEDRRAKARPIPTGVDALEMTYVTSRRIRGIPSDRASEPLPCDSIASRPGVNSHPATASALSVDSLLQRGESVFQLFSVLVHAGSAVGGHYYAYINSFEDGRWYLFDDSDVTEVSEEEVRGTYGGDGEKDAGTAYLLVYRRAGEQGAREVRDEEVPEYVREVVEADKRKEMEEAAARREQMRLLSFRIFYQGQEKTLQIDMKKTLSDLLRLAVTEFHLEMVPSSDVRLRGYLPSQETMAETYEGLNGSLLSSLSLPPFKPFALEVKSPNDSFRPYDPSLISLRMVPWDRSYSDEFPLTSLTEKSSKWVKIAMSVNDTVKELVGKVEKEARVERGKAVVLRRGVAGSAEVVSRQDNLGKTLREMKIGEQSLLYLEEGMEGQSEYKWASEFLSDLFRSVIKFNSPSSPELKHQLLISSTAPLSILKQSISKQLDLHIDSFILRKGGSRLGSELKDLDKKVMDVGLEIAGSVWVELGTPIGREEVRVEVAIAVEPKAGSGDGCLATLHPLTSLVLLHSTPISSIKSLVSQSFERLFPSTPLPISHFHLREQVQDRMGRAMRESQVLSDYPPLDNKAICVQSFGEWVGDLDPEDVIVAVKLWNPLSWDLGSPRHMILPRSLSLSGFAQQLSELYSIPSSLLEATKIAFPVSFSRMELPYQAWVPLTSDDVRLESSPLSLITDGALLVIRDKSKPMQSVPPLIDLHITQKTETMLPANLHKEKPMVITVKHGKMEDA